MKTPNLNKIFGRTVSIQVTIAWTFVVIISYFIGDIWLKSEILTHVVLWLAGVLAFGFIFSRGDTAHEKGKDAEGRQISSLIYHAVMETSPDSVAVTDLLGNYIFANKQTAVLHGYDSTEEFIGKSAFGFFPLSEVPKATKYMNLTRADGIIKNIEFDLQRKDGSTFPAELSAALIKNEFGIPVAFIAVTRDITERRRVADQLHDMNDQLRLQLGEIEKLQAILHEQAIQDPLTGLYNRRFMEEALKQEFARASRGSQPFSVVMLDMDNLKTLNDKYGHVVGDAALKSLSKLLKDQTRTEDIVCRFGGDEFLVILHNANEQIAAVRLQEWSERAKAIHIVHEGSQLQVSFSAGIATYPTCNSIEELIRAADKALYDIKAKKKQSL
ncbi:MAG: sensor domain-containing diguanylate cyclase [Anaerolineales bacterium]|nr:sensor domain-containing diguanylate cyclase [Anaerolineales bacterium]